MIYHHLLYPLVTDKPTGVECPELPDYAGVSTQRVPEGPHYIRAEPFKTCEEVLEQEMELRKIVSAAKETILLEIMEDIWDSSGSSEKWRHPI